MSQNSCCIPGCEVTRKDGFILHRFPNPDTNAERFKTWISNIGGEITKLDTEIVFNNRRVCSRHFEEIHKYPNNRLCSLAVPVLHIMPDCQAYQSESVAAADICEVSTSAEFHTNQINEEESSSSIILELELPKFDVIPTEPSLSSTSSIGKTCSTIVVSGPHKKIESLETEGHIFKQINQQRSKGTKSKRPRLSQAQLKIFKTIVKRLQKCEAEKNDLKRKYTLAKKITQASAFKIVSKHMSNSMKKFFHMQVFQSGKKKRGRRFSLDEKLLALSIYKPSPKAYRLLNNIFVLPSRQTLQNLLQKISLKPGTNI